ncbi:MAG: glycerol-3-phosphate cytidylyltransferase [Candidatus Sericytochromatia bacterium]|nr:MAG: glycerol-3-phosphate cytidylyltransferase [Candidatus Sericytochromatia bacterium]GIX40804.1 MAG: glycerol-3-phosphate cytidylyltransferase [Leptospiraceae bacterium]
MNILENIYKKIKTNEEELLNQINTLKLQKKKIVFTNGCFDILHTGHINYLARAKELGDILIVAVNSDHSVKRLKGKERPINTLNDRMFLLASLCFIDIVTFFEEDTPTEILKKIKPDIHVKGGDYKIEDLPEKQIIESYGGKIIILPFVQGYSTTNIITKMKK